MTNRWIAKTAGAAFLSLVAYTAHSRADAASGSAEASRLAIAQIVPGKSTKADIESLLGAPWRVVQFNDCGMAMDDQADETWEYRGADQDGNYRLHIEFTTALFTSSPKFRIARPAAKQPTRRSRRRKR